MTFGNYSIFVSQVESLYRSSILVALDEYGIPIQIGEQLERQYQIPDNLDAALDTIRHLDVAILDLDAYEREIVADAQSSM